MCRNGRGRVLREKLHMTGVERMKGLRSAAAEVGEKKTEKSLIVLLMLVGMIVRLAALGQCPGGVHQDEAYSAYEAYCMISDGMDSWGYRYPVYLTTWGSGMNALQSYLMMPFIALFGLKTWVLRLPQALLACATLPVIYSLLKRMFSKETAVICLAFLVICPWQITMARWGLESNMAPGMILLGFWAFVKGVQNPKYYVLSALFYGVSLYAYATIWPVLPFMILLHALYLWYVGKMKWNRWLFAGVLLLGVLALPLVLFLAVNWDMIGEIRTPFMSIPRMLEFRTGDISLNHLYENVYRLVKTFLLQRDDRVWNASDEFGLYYHISPPFIAVGAISCLISTVKSLKTRRYHGGVLILIWLILGGVLGCLIDGNVNRLNILHFPLIICAVVGIQSACKWVNKRINWFGKAIATAYALCFLLFVGFYFTEYQNLIAPQFNRGLEEAVEFAKGVADKEEIIHVSDWISYPKILFYDEMEPDVFRSTVEWRWKKHPYMMINAAGRYVFETIDEYDQSGVYIMVRDRMSDEIPDGSEMECFGQIAVVYPADPKKN